MQTKEQLIEQLKEYKDLLNTEIIDYLNGILNLDYSVVRDDIIDIKVKEHLSELDIYKEFAIYNIYNRTKMLIEKFDKDNLLLFIEAKDFDWCSAQVASGVKSPMSIFEFYYGNNNMVEDDEFCYINLIKYPSIARELETTGKRIELLCYEKNMFDGICSSNEKYERDAKYNNLKKYYEYLKKLGTDSDNKYKLNYANDCLKMIARDYKLESSKCLMVKKPGFTIREHIEHL